MNPAPMIRGRRAAASACFSATPSASVRSANTLSSRGTASSQRGLPPVARTSTSKRSERPSSSVMEESRRLAATALRSPIHSMPSLP
jgi:hypothetical protein